MFPMSSNPTDAKVVSTLPLLIMMLEKTVEICPLDCYGREIKR